MSRIGNAPVRLPEGVTLTVQSGTMIAAGPKGQISRSVPEGVKVEVKDNVATVVTSGITKKDKSLHGFIRAQLANDITGVSRGWSKVLELSGVGFRAIVTGTDLVLTIGFSHPVTVKPPAGIAFSVAENKITVTGIDKHLVGQIASNVRSIRPPEPYKGKGIKYADERIRKKAGKSAKAVGGAPGAAAK